jgi:hypothetical protein
VIKVPRQISKGRQSFVAFITPECKQAIQAYLKQRELRGEELVETRKALEQDQRQIREMGLRLSELEAGKGQTGPRTPASPDKKA